MADRMIDESALSHQIAAVIDKAAFELWREDKARVGWARDASKRRRIALTKAEKIIQIVKGGTA